MTISFKERKPSYRGTIKGGWIKVPANKDVGLPIYIKVSWYYRIWIVIKMLPRLFRSVRFNHG
jgi:hypothetical protein